MRIPLPRGRFIILHPLRIGLVVGLVGMLIWAFGALGGVPVALEPPAVMIPFVVEEPQAIMIPPTGGNLPHNGLFVVEFPAGVLLDNN